MHLTVHNACRIGFHRSVRALRADAGLEIESPAVHRTENRAAIEMAAAERLAAVRTHVVDAVELAIQIPERKHAALHMDTATTARSKAGRLRDRNEFTHDATIQTRVEYGATEP